MALCYPCLCGEISACKILFPQSGVFGWAEVDGA
jgi:hypothetical protein